MKFNDFSSTIDLVNYYEELKSISPELYYPTVIEDFFDEKIIPWLDATGSGEKIVPYLELKNQVDNLSETKLVLEFLRILTGDDSNTIVESEVNKDREFNVDGVIFKMVYVEGGQFSMGDGHDGAPFKRVTTSDFFCGETQVTKSLWKAVMRGECPKPSFDNPLQALEYGMRLSRWKEEKRSFSKPKSLSNVKNCEYSMSEKVSASAGTS